MVEMIKTFQGYELRKPDLRIGKDHFLYVSKVKKDGTYEWTMDFTYERHFSEMVAKKHMEILNAPEIIPEEIIFSYYGTRCHAKVVSGIDEAEGLLIGEINGFSVFKIQDNSPLFNQFGFIAVAK